MINIIVVCNPSYQKKITHASNRGDLSHVTQLIVLYKSILANWKSIEYDFYIVCNKHIKWTEADLKRMEQFPNIHRIEVEESDVKSMPYMTLSPCFTSKLIRTGTHRMVLNCDMIALSEPVIDYTCDWQGGFACSSVWQQDGVSHKKMMQRIIDDNNLDVNLDDYAVSNTTYVDYVRNPESYDYKKIFPHINAGIFFIKEELCAKYADLLLKSLKYMNHVHISVQYIFSVLLIGLSKNWKPFHPGMNFLVKDIAINKFGRENIGLLHYAGVSEHSRENIYKSQVLPLLKEFSD